MSEQSFDENTYNTNDIDGITEPSTLEDHLDIIQDEIPLEEFDQLYINPPQDYKPINLEELWNYNVSEINETNKTSETYDSSPEIMSDEEIEEAVVDVQFAQITGDTQSMSYKDRQRLANTALYDPIGVRIMHSLNRLTDDVNFSKVY